MRVLLLDLDAKLTSHLSFEATRELIDALNTSLLSACTYRLSGRKDAFVCGLKVQFHTSPSVSCRALHLLMRYTI